MGASSAMAEACTVAARTNASKPLCILIPVLWPGDARRIRAGMNAWIVLRADDQRNAAIAAARVEGWQEERQGRDPNRAASEVIPFQVGLDKHVEGHHAQRQCRTEAKLTRRPWATE